jgi:hypothetical protein
LIVKASTKRSFSFNKVTFEQFYKATSTKRSFCTCLFVLAVFDMRFELIEIEATF